VTGRRPRLEIAWFAALCDDDYEQLGVVDERLLSSPEHCGEIMRAADESGFDSILLPSGYSLGIDTVTFAAAMASSTHSIRPIVAVRIGEVWLPTLARQLATLDRLFEGRLIINVISSEMPGERLESPQRYRRTLEHMEGLRALLDGDRLEIDGEWLQLSIDPPRVRTATGNCPPLYFGGLSDEARDVAARQADVYLMWPDTLDRIGALVDDLRTRANSYGRKLAFGFRVHVVVRPTEAEARSAADHLIAALEPAMGDEIRARSLDSTSVGVQAQAALRNGSDRDGYAEPNLWTGIGRARSGCGAAIVGSPQQVADKINAYRELGIETFILSGYPHLDECERFAELVLPLLKG
jgi:alkanesulfonate monooxygenase